MPAYPSVAATAQIATYNLMRSKCNNITLLHLFCAKI